MGNRLLPSSHLVYSLLNSVYLRVNQELWGDEGALSSITGPASPGSSIKNKKRHTARSQVTGIDG